MADPDDIRGWQRLSSEITTSGKLDPDDVARLHAIGVRHVINLALDDHPEALRDEAALLEAQGIGYTHIPVAFERPTVDHYLEFREALKSSQGPVHVHCIMSFRVSAFFYMLHREQGMAGKEAEALMARQWNPLTSEDPRTLPWRDLLMRTAGSPTGP
ncbi:protein tyrosine phosphatase family protein [Qipengyuania sp. XHP0207]|uniref:protein tyrosine phosphatase family protein n=1 Tax=Qipengyuania sp. XHP0207 TaxID=3038078 RepID=UPI00241F6197|nr:protein tyrosine phosphatase family protein [Qipengyuania sp. XHP0207]MDG5748368.1 protein tyrosine phosphatase family protein [Qipengyuania sp. XHP0207]